MTFTCLALLTGCGGRLSGVYEADYHDLMSRQLGSMGPAMNPLLQSLPQATRQSLEQQQNQLIDQTASQLSQSIPTRLVFSGGKVTLALSGVEVTSGYELDSDSLVIRPGGGPMAYRLMRQPDGNLSFSGVVFRLVPGTASATPMAAGGWIVGIVIAVATFGCIWLLRRQGVLAAAKSRGAAAESVSLETLALQKLTHGAGGAMAAERTVKGKGAHHATPSQPEPAAVKQAQDDSRFMPPGMRNRNADSGSSGGTSPSAAPQAPKAVKDDSRFMPPGMRPHQ